METEEKEGVEKGSRETAGIAEVKDTGRVNANPKDKEKEAKTEVGKVATRAAGVEKKGTGKDMEICTADTLDRKDTEDTAAASTEMEDTENQAEKADTKDSTMLNLGRSSGGMNGKNHYAHWISAKTNNQSKVRIPYPEKKKKKSPLHLQSLGLIKKMTRTEICSPIEAMKTKTRPTVGGR